MEPPLLSIITPSFNQSDFIEENILSVKEQDYPHIEHIIVDGGSSDGTTNILQKYEGEYNLKWISESDRGQSHAINKGVHMASGDWIGWQNSDDFYLQDSFSRFFDALKANPESDLIYGDLLIVDKVGNEIGRNYTIPPSAFVQRHWSLFAKNQSLFIRSSSLEEIGLLNEDYDLVMDADLIWRAIQSDLKMTNISEFLGAFRKHEEAKTSGNVREQQQQELELAYGESWQEKIFPTPILETSAKILKASYLIKHGKWEAISDNFPKNTFRK